MYCLIIRQIKLFGCVVALIIFIELFNQWIYPSSVTDFELSSIFSGWFCPGPQTKGVVCKEDINKTDLNFYRSTDKHRGTCYN